MRNNDSIDTEYCQWIINIHKQHATIGLLISTNDASSNLPTEDLIKGSIQIKDLLKMLQESKMTTSPDQLAGLIKLLECVKNIFEYCKVTGEKHMKIVDDEISTANLSALFKSNYQNLKVLVEFLINQIESHSEERVFIRTVHQDMIEIADILMNLDSMASVALWKSLKRISTATASNDSINIPNTIKVLIKVLSRLHNEQAEIDDKLDDKNFKIFKFFISLKFHYLKKLDVKDGDVNKQIILELLLQVSMIQHRLRVIENEKLIELLQCQVDSILSFVSMNPSSSSVFKENMHLLSSSCLLNMLETLAEKSSEDVLDHWLDSKSDCTIFHLVFHFMDVHTEKLFACEMDNGSIYEELLWRTCVFATRLSTSHFHVLEEMLFVNTISKVFYRSMLANDLWCFIARWSNSKLCFSHFTFIGKMIIYLSNEEINEIARMNLSLLFKRIFYFIPEEQYNEIIEVFTPSVDTLCLWRLMNISHIPLNNHPHVCATFIQSMLNVMEMKDNHKYLVDACICCVNLLQDNKDMISDNLQQYICAFVNGFWSDSLACCQLNENVCVAVLHLTSSLLSTGDVRPLSLNLVLKAISWIVEQTKSLPFMLATCHLLVNLRSLKFEKNIEKSCLEEIRSIFHFLFDSQDDMLEWEIMQSLKEYAEMTPYTNILVQCLPPSKKKEFAAFLKKNVLMIKTMENRVFNCLTPSIAAQFPKDTASTEEVRISILSIKQEMEKLCSTLKRSTAATIGCKFRSQIDSIDILWKEINSMTS